MYFKTFIFALFCAMCTIQAIGQTDEAVSNQTILDLVAEGFSSDEIIAFIDNASTRQITMGLTEMRELKAAGAEPALITYLQKICKTDNGFEGVYWWNAGEKPKKVYRCAFEKEKKGGSGGFLGTVGAVTGAVLGGSKGAVVGSIAGGALLASTAAEFQKLIVQGSCAKVVLDGENASNPVFRFYFPKTQNNSFEQTGDSWYMSIMNQIESPNEFQCIKMKQDTKKNKRSFPDGVKYSAAGFGSSGSGNKDIVNFEINEVNNNTFEVIFPDGLEAGEYIFFYKNGLQNEYFQQHPFGFDFSVQ